MANFVRKNENEKPIIFLHTNDDSEQLSKKSFRLDPPSLVTDGHEITIYGVSRTLYSRTKKTPNISTPPRPFHPI
jgi:hypothetical protein